ncbi:NCS2 family permease [Fluviispira vulneris]|uniref:NCS2 family permease n=1 Tax=Fluviispira vulneris TaxID=2763012 RepID=UPI001647B02F|nr:NCS2 family permease [Fluviispira vulneris]
MNALKVNYSQEIIAGLTTFFTMSYIVIVNPQVMASPGTGLTVSGTLTATVLISFLMSLLAGIYIRLPYALAPGMGLNVFIAYSLIIGEKIPWPTALGIIFWSSFIFILISVLPIRQKIVEALPNNMKHAMSCGIGLFLAFIGMKNLGLIVPNSATYISLGDINLPITLGLIGFLIIFILFNKNKSYAFLFSIFLVTIIALLCGLTKLPETYFSTPDFQSHFFKLDLIGSLKWSFIPVILSVLLTNLFDSMSSLIGLANSAGFTDKKGNPLQLKETLMVDSIASLFSSLFGTSPATVFIESSTGIQAGGRTGLTAIVAAFCFLPCLFIAPIVTAIPVFATAPILIFVGILMCKTLKHIKANTLDDIIPIFLTIILMPLTFSITQGVLWGIVSYVILKICVGKIKVISPVLWVLALICFLALVTEHSTFLEFIMK